MTGKLPVTRELSALFDKLLDVVNDDGLVIGAELRRWLKDAEIAREVEDPRTGHRALRKNYWAP